MAKKKTKRRRSRKMKVGRRRRSGGLPGWVKTGAKVAIGGLVGALFAPLTGPVSSTALGIVGAGLLTSGFSSRSLVPMGIAAGVQAIHTVERSGPFTKAKNVVADATSKLKYGASPSSGGGGGGFNLPNISSADIKGIASNVGDAIAVGKLIASAVA